MNKEHRLYDPKEIVAKGDVKPEEINSKFADILTMNLEYVLNSEKKEDWAEASTDLHKLLMNQIKNCDPKTWEAIRDFHDWEGNLNDLDSESLKIYQGYVLGKISFAQQLISHMTMRKPDDKIVDFLNSDDNKHFFDIMAEAKKEGKEPTIQELHIILGGDIQELASLIRKCRGLGLLKFRNAGLGVVHNSLTDGAASVYSPV